MPIGSIIQTLSPQQDNWLLCEGQEISPEVYPELLNFMLSVNGSPIVPDLRPYDSKGSVIEPSSLTVGMTINGLGYAYVPHYIVAKLDGGILAPEE